MLRFFDFMSLLCQAFATKNKYLKKNAFEAICTCFKNVNDY